MTDAAAPWVISSSCAKGWAPGRTSPVQRHLQMAPTGSLGDHSPSLYREIDPELHSDLVRAGLAQLRQDGLRRRQHRLQRSLQRLHCLSHPFRPPGLDHSTVNVIHLHDTHGERYR